MNHAVANPAVIIGLGGTGKWVLTYVKKSLLDTYGGVVPKTVRLLSFDTTAEKGSQEGRANEEDVRVGNVQLDKQSEFLYLGGSIYQLCQEIRDGKHPHIGSWLQAKHYLQTSDSDAFDISRGAGQKRPFGRMSVFYDLQQTMQSKVVNKIQTAISEVIGHNQRSQAVEIYIIASLAGGTGSGLCIDVAHLARWFAEKKIKSGFAIRGFLALHNTFSAVIQTSQIQPQSFAAMREIDRFMLVFDQQYPIVYNPANPDLNTIYGGKLGKLFDNCYLLDASRENLPLDGSPPQYGVFPSIANCITMLLDSSTGDAYAQHYKNVNTRITDFQKQIGQPIYSSLGTYSLILPVEDIITSLTYRFAIELLGTYLLQLEQVMNDAGQLHYVLRYDGNAHEEASSLLRSPHSISGVANTNFIQLVPTTVEKTSAKDMVYINEVAEMDSDELLTWIMPPETDPTVSQIARDVRRDLDVSLINVVLPSSTEGDDPIEGCNRIIRQARKFREEHLGRDVGGRRTGGTYRNALDKCVSIHAERYRTLIQEHLLRLLNGSEPRNATYQHEKYGRLGKAQALFSHLSLLFADFSAFVERVQERRAEWDELRGSQEEASLARSHMEKEKDNIGFIGRFGFKDLQPAIKAQRSYLDAEQQVIDVEIKDMFFEFLKRTSDMLRSITDEYKSAIDVWISTLAHGFTGTYNDPGLYHFLRGLAAKHETNRDDKERIVVHDYMTERNYTHGEYTSGTFYEDQLYRQTIEEKFAEAMSQLVWEHEQRNDTFYLVLSNCTPGGSVPRGGRTATDRNAEHFLNIAKSYFEPLRDTLNIADRLVEMDPMRVATMLLDKCSPLIRFDPLKTGGSQEFHYFVCVNEGKHKLFFNEFRDALRRLGRTAKDNQVLDSSNPYTCTILATADVISSYGLHAYMSAEHEYNTYTGDARLLHIFPAEVNAVQLEQQLPMIREDRRRFSPILTTMLEDQHKVEQFFLAYLYHFIAIEKATGMNSYWTLHVPAQKQKRRAESKFALTRPSASPSLFDAMECFVFRGSDINNDSMKIDFDLLDYEIQAYQDTASQQNDSRLINLLESLIDNEIEPLRSDKDPANHDLGSLMRLIVDKFITGTHHRIKISGERYDPDLAPFPVPSVRAEQHPPRPRQEVAEPRDVVAPDQAPPAVDAESLTPVATDDAEAKLRELNGLLADGLIAQDHYQSEIERLGLQVDEKTPRERLKELKKRLDDGSMPREEYDAKVKEILATM